jgi:hypothetical protein
MVFSEARVKRKLSFYMSARTCCLAWHEEYALVVGSMPVVSCKLLGWSVVRRGVKTLESCTVTTAFPSIKVSCPGHQFVPNVVER